MTRTARIQAIRAHQADNVATALEALPAGAAVEVEGAEIRIRDDVPAGHKFALAGLARGEPVIRFGAAIGHATRAAAPGGNVHPGAAPSRARAREGGL